MPVALRWGDMDAYGHINNVEILRLIEEARVRVIWRADNTAENLPTAVLDQASDSVMTVVARVETEYVAQMPYSRSPAEVDVWFGAIGGASFDMCYEVYSPAGVEARTLVARSVVTMVTVAATDGRPIRLPQSCRAAWADFVGEPVIFTRRPRSVSKS